MIEYVEVTIEEALKKCNKNDKVLVAVRDLENVNISDTNNIFVVKEKNEYPSLFNDVETVIAACDSFMKQLQLFTTKQKYPSLTPEGIQKIVLLKE